MVTGIGVGLTPDGPRTETETVLTIWVRVVMPIFVVLMAVVVYRSQLAFWFRRP